jgi:hypothetical protein
VVARRRRLCLWRASIYHVEAERTEATRATIRASVKAYADAGIWMDRGLVMAEDEYEAEV